MILRIDFDNTIVSYDRVFHEVALDQGLIPADLPVSKTKVRDYLRKAGKEDLWTDMQGYVYGERMIEALPFPGAVDFFKSCMKLNVTVHIISHKTLYPYGNGKYNLHESAQRWLEKQGFYDPAVIGLDKKQVHFVVTKEEKLLMIGSMGCTHFIDDLPEFLAEKKFPANVHRILFDPTGIYAGIYAGINPGKQDLHRAETWGSISKEILSH